MLFDHREHVLPEIPTDDHSLMESSETSVEPSEHMSMSMDEGEMHRHLMDVESSFIPDVGQAPFNESGSAGKLGADDTYLELGTAGHTPPPDHMFGSLRRSRSQRSQLQDEISADDVEPETPADAYKTPRIRAPLQW